MNDIKLSDLLEMQNELFELNKNNWNPLEPEFAKDSFLWMIEEIGECISLIKKKGHEEIVTNPKIRELFMEEMVDVLMYYSQVLLRMGITSAEMGKICLRKHQKNINRNYEKEYEDKFK